MKKYLSISAVFLVAVIAIFVTLGCIKPTLNLQYDEPSKVYVYANSNVALQNGKGEREFTPASKTYENITLKTKEMFDISMFSHAANGSDTTPVVRQDVDNTYGKYSPSVLNTKYAVAYTFEEEQKQIVEYDGSTKPIYYFGFIIIIDPEKNYQEAPIYFKESTDGSYKDSPMLVYLQAEKLVEYINEIK